MPLKLRAATVGVAIAMTVGGCAPGVAANDPSVSSTLRNEPIIHARHALAQFGSCDAFLDYVIEHALEIVGPYGLDGGGFWPWARRQSLDGFTDDTMAAAETDGGGSDFSTTNVQVEGVDEPDIVKSDGERIVALVENELIVVDVTEEEPVEVGRLRLEGGASIQGMFLHGDSVLLFGSQWSHHPMPLVEADAIAPMPATPTLQVFEVAIDGDPEVVQTLTVDGAYISARQTGEATRMVISSGPVGFEWSYPSGSGLRAERTAIEENREIIRNSTPENWIPYYIVTDADGRVTGEGTLFDCDRARHPAEFSGLDMLSLVTFETEGGLEIVDATGLLATGDMVYASHDSFYVATQNWQAWQWAREGGEETPDGPVTEIHKFDISDPGHSDYVASGAVDGYLLNQFAMDEHEGMLRVASTTAPAGWGAGPDSESVITVLRQIGDGLVRVGGVGGLGKTEQIYAVRFMEDVAYVVTFRQVDPLYTVDLSNPRSPRVRGELKIPGYSAYLHPVGEGLVLGVGQDATDEGVIQGTQVSLFDVSDLTDPTRIDTVTVGDGTSSQVEYDHHAFLLWGDRVFIPVQEWHWDDKGESAFLGAIALAVEPDGLADVGRISHPGGDMSPAGEGFDWRAQILRTVAVDDVVYTISAKGIMKSDIETLDELAWFDF